MNSARQHLLDTVRKIVAVLGLKFSAGQSLSQIEDEYATTLYEIMDDYANHDRPVTSYRNRYNRAANDAMNGSVYVGWADGGASGPIPGALQDWVNTRIDQEVGYIADMFQGLKELRAEGDMDALANFIQDRAQGYTASLEGVYLQGKAYAMGERPGVWHLGATEVHCDTCAGLDGKTHPISWYIDNKLVPRQAGNTNFECGGWRCDCGVYDPETGEQLL
jgi:hypothetical protein